MARKRKCKICGEWIEDNNKSIPYKNGYVHEKCFDIAMKITTTEKRETLNKEKKPKKSPELKPLKDGLSEEEYQTKQNLYNYIKKLTREDLSVATYKLIDDYKNKYKISYAEMQEDLVWYFELCEHEVDGDMVIGVVPNCHTEAQKYYQSLRETNASCQDKIDKLDDMYKETTATTSNKRRIKSPLIDVGAIGGDE